jgi:hypothetical protein
MAKNKTFKFDDLQDDELERIKVEKTKKVDLNGANDVKGATEYELSKLSKAELEYKLEFEKLDHNTKTIIKKLLKNK